MKCKRTNSAPGLFVTSYSGYKNKAMCTVPANDHLRHHIVVENLQLYDADVTCQGFIRARPPSLSFLSTVAGDTSMNWTGIVSLHQDTSKEFQHVEIHACGAGRENIIAEVTVVWPDPHEQTTLSISIEVNP